MHQKPVSFHEIFTPTIHMPIQDKINLSLAIISVANKFKKSIANCAFGRMWQILTWFMKFGNIYRAWRHLQPHVTKWRSTLCWRQKREIALLQATSCDVAKRWLIPYESYANVFWKKKLDTTRLHEELVSKNFKYDNAIDFVVSLMWYSLDSYQRIFVEWYHKINGIIIF